MNDFKTKVIEKYYDMHLKQYPILNSYKDELRNMLVNIKLPDNPSCGYETFYQELDLWGCGTVPITWNIEKLLTYAPDDSDFEIHKVSELLTLIDFNSKPVREVMAELLPKGNIKHRGKYIIIAILPGFPGAIIIDGNHRVLEERSNPNHTFKCFMLGDKRVCDFLEPNSRKFIESIYYINKKVIG